LSQAFGTLFYGCLLIYIFRQFSPIARKTFQIQAKPNIEIREHWAGKLPQSAQEILDMMNFPHVYSHFSSQLPRGLLLHGLPGTGKTHFARIICEAANAEFFYASAAELDEIYVGVGAQRIRTLFDSACNATKYSTYERVVAYMTGQQLPQKRAVVFIDELDAIGNRNSHQFTNHTHTTVSQLLTCLDGLVDRDNVFIIGATNNLANIDPALRRSGRFDRVVVMPLPDKDSRVDLTLYYMRTVPGKEELIRSGFVDDIAELTAGFSAADIKNFVSEATMAAVHDTIANSKDRLKTQAVTLEECALKKVHLVKSLIVLHSKVSEERKALGNTIQGIPALISKKALDARCAELIDEDVD
jgi:SpoVK/Ycf46/Vps4 family AAA+-type ATPase